MSSKFHYTEDAGEFSLEDLNNPGVVLCGPEERKAEIRNKS